MVSACRYDDPSPLRELVMQRLKAENASLLAALEPFGRNAKAKSLSDALGHITREDLLYAQALSGSAKSREELEAENDRLRTGIEEIINGLEGLDQHVNNPVYDRLRKLIDLNWR